MKKIERSSLGIFIIPDKEKIAVLYGHEIKYTWVSRGEKKKKEFRRILHEIENSASKKESKKKKEEPNIPQEEQN